MVVARRFSGQSGSAPQQEFQRNVILTGVLQNGHVGGDPGRVPVDLVGQLGDDLRRSGANPVLRVEQAAEAAEQRIAHGSPLVPFGNIAVTDVGEVLLEIGHAEIAGHADEVVGIVSPPGGAGKAHGRAVQPLHRGQRPPVGHRLEGPGIVAANTRDPQPQRKSPGADRSRGGREVGELDGVDLGAEAVLLPTVVEEHLGKAGPGGQGGLRANDRVVEVEFEHGPGQPLRRVEGGVIGGNAHVPVQEPHVGPLDGAIQGGRSSGEGFLHRPGVGEEKHRFRDEGFLGSQDPLEPLLVVAQGPVAAHAADAEGTSLTAIRPRDSEASPNATTLDWSTSSAGVKAVAWRHPSASRRASIARWSSSNQRSPALATSTHFRTTG